MHKPSPMIKYLEILNNYLILLQIGLHEIVRMLKAAGVRSLI